jgi:hypothetical protein
VKTPRISNDVAQCLTTAVADSHDDVRSSEMIAWLAADLLDARAEIARLQAQADTYVAALDAAAERDGL